MRVLSVVLLFISTSVFAQQPQADFMQKMLQVQECMAQISETDITELQKKGEQMTQDVKQLCQQNKRDQAQSKALIYAREIAKEPMLIQLRKCSEIAQGVIPAPTFELIEDELKNRHVCDS